MLTKWGQISYNIYIRWFPPPENHKERANAMKRFFLFVAVIALALPCAGALAADYTKNSDGIYVDASGAVIEDLWDESAGLYIVNGTGYAIVDTDDPNYTDTESDGVVQNEDGSITVDSGAIQSEDPVAEQHPGHLTNAEWAARMAKASAKNGTTTGVVYLAEDGNAYPAVIRSLGLAKSTVLVGGQQMRVPTSSIRWDNQAPEEKQLAVVSTKKQTYATLRAKKSAKSFVMGHCDKCKVMLVINTGKTWTLVDCDGVRGYVLTSSLTFYDNKPKNYACGIITVHGKTPSGNTVHVRSSNQNGARQIAEFPVGTEIEVYMQEGRWSEIDVGGLHCYILSEFVTLSEPLMVASAEPEE